MVFKLKINDKAHTEKTAGTRKRKETETTRISEKTEKKNMSIRNKVTLIGRTGKEVESFQFENGQKATVSLATSDYYTNAQGEKVETTEWHNLVAFGKVAEIMQKYVEKGKEIAIEGKITYRSYDDKDGQKRYVTEIKVDEILLLGGK